MKPKSVVLLSSGLDSTVNFCKAVVETDVVLSLTFDYGQKAAQKEIEMASAICKRYGVSHKVVLLNWLKAITQTALVNQKRNLPSLSHDDLDNKDKGLKSASQVWVPNRNGLFINIAASFAETLDADQIIVGFNAEEAMTFPDNSPEFIAEMNKSLSYSTLRQPKVHCYTTGLNKLEIVQLGHELKSPFDLMWSCYLDGNEICGKCESCLRFQRAVDGGQHVHA